MSEVSIFGVDVDQARLVVAGYERSGTQSIENRSASIREWLRQVPPGSRIGVESTSRYHDLLVGLALAAGHTVFVLNPRDVRHYAKGLGRRGKTDRVDAGVIARYVAKEADQLHAYRPRTDAQQALHVLHQQRAAVQRAITQMHQALTAHGRTNIFDTLMNAARDALRQIDRRIQALVRQGGDADLFRRLMTVPGIGPVIAACLVQHLKRWPLPRVDAWIACTGLDPRPNDSGRKVGVRVLSKRGNAMLRQMLYMAAMTFARHPLGKALADRYRQRSLSATATYNILARLLARVVWSIDKNEQPFNAKRFAKDHQIEIAT